MSSYVKRYIRAILVFMIIFILIFICVHFLSKGYTNKYSIGDFSIKEVYTKDEQNEHDNYYIEIAINDTVYNYQFYKQIEDDNKLVKDIIYYDGEYKCLLPILSDNIKVDFLCYKDKKYYNYYDIIGKEEHLDEFIEDVDDNKYSISDFKDNTNNSKEYKKVTYYKDNIPDDFIISMSTLRGILSISDKLDYIELFDKDIYKRELSTYSNNYYITADYSDKQEFREFFVVNLLNGKEKIIKAPDFLSFDAYIQGIVNNCIYIYDINNEKQYSLNIDELSINEEGNATKGIRYYDGNWSTISTIKANNKQLFTNNNLSINDNQYVLKDGKKLSGFYYYFYETDDGYKVYRANVQNKKIKKYLFTVKDYKDIILEEDYVFYKDNNTIKMYSDYTGIKTIIKNTELEFNDNIYFNAYKK